MSTYLITGGAGFIGSNMACALSEQGHTVRVLDDLSSGDVANLADAKVDFVEGDIRDVQAVARIVEGCDYVLHLAAVPSVVRSVEEPERTNDVNVNGTLNVLQRAREAGVKRVVFAGSSAVYGDSEVLPKVETMTPAPLSPYALHKLAGEYYGHLYTQLYGLEVVTVRYFNVFGPRQDPNSEYSAVIPKFITLMQQGRAPIIFGDGLQTRDFCHIDNVVEATLKACTAQGAAGRTFNVACGDRISLLQLVDTINQTLGTSLVATHEPDRAGDVKHSFASIDVAREVLGYTAAVSFAAGLQRTIEWYGRQG